MIQIYNKTNLNFDNNGDMTLFPIQCEIDTSTWQLILEHPIDEENRWKYIIEEAVIKAPSFNGDQLFRIEKVNKKDSGVEATAYPIFYDTKDEVFLESVHPTNKTGQEALDIMMEGTKYFGETDITTVNTAYYENKNLLEALQGTDENSFINRWGGEVMYDNFKIIIQERLGDDYGLSIRYGKNVAYDGFAETIDMSETVTRIYPKAYNGRMLSTKYVDSPLIGSYAKIRTKELEFSDIKLSSDVIEGDTEGIICDNQEELDVALIQRCNELYAEGMDKPKVSINVNFILLENTTAYELYKNLEHVHLGDTVYCQHDRLGIVSTARVVNVVYDCIAKKVIKAEIGSHILDYVEKTTNIIDSASQVINTSNKTLLGEKIQGVIDLLNTSLKAQKNIAEKQDVRAILFEDLDPNSPTFGAMCIGTQGIQLAKKRNETDSDWEWGTAIDFQAIYADYVIAGILSDKSGNNYWNLDTGDFQLTSSAKIDEKTVKDYVDDISSDAVTTYDKTLTQQQIFNRLTNNGQLQGIYQKNGLLYINAEYIDAETLSAISANLGAITGGSLNINNKFIVNANGVLTAKGATIDGTITATKGNIGGFDINNTGFTKTTAKTLKKTYTSADVTRVENIIKGSVTPTTSDYNYYDINNSGTITALDLIWIEKILVPCGGNILYTDVIINSYPFDTNDINKPMMTVRYRGTNGTTICESSISARTLSTLIINANSITANTLSVKYGDTLNDFGNKTQFTCYNDDSSVGGIIYAEYFSGTPNFYILAENGGYLTLGTLGNRWYFQDVDDTNWKSVFYPRYTGSALGKSGKPWYRLYAENSTTVTSDRRVKCDFRNMDERYIEFVEYLMPQLYHRIGHENLPLESGFVAQDVEEAMIKAGISNDELGLVEHYINEKEGIDRYSLVYEGFISILLYYIQKKNISYEERLKKLEEAILNGNGNN